MQQWVALGTSSAHDAVVSRLPIDAGAAPGQRQAARHL